MVFMFTQHTSNTLSFILITQYYSGTMAVRQATLRTRQALITTAKVI